MKVKLIARHFEASEELENRIHKKLKKLNKFDKWISHVEIILNGEADRRNTEINVKLDHKKINAKSKGRDAFETFSSALNKIIRQVKEYESRVTDHHG